MFSTCLELCGLAAITIATYICAGVPAALYCAGGLLLLVGYAVEDEKAALALGRATLPARRILVSLRERREQRRRRSELSAKAG